MINFDVNITDINFVLTVYLVRQRGSYTTKCENDAGLLVWTAAINNKYFMYPTEFVLEFLTIHDYWLISRRNKLKCNTEWEENMLVCYFVKIISES